MIAMSIAGESVTSFGFVGLGVMGEPMCGNLALNSGIRVYGVDHRDEPLLALSKMGVIACGSAADVGKHAEIVVVCVATGEQLREVCFGEDGLVNSEHRVKVIVDCSTSSVALTNELADRCRKLGIDWVDAPIARGREAARNATLSFMVGATQDLFDALLPMFNCMGTDVTRCGDTGAGQVVKILNNKVMIQAVHALAEALAIADASGVDGATLFDVFSKGSADSQVLRYQGIKFMLPRNFPRAAFPTSYAKKDMGLAIELAAEYGIDTRLAQHTFDFLDHAIDAGHSLDYYPVILTLFKPRGPVA